MSKRRLSTIQPLTAHVAGAAGPREDAPPAAAAPAGRRRQSTRKSFGTSYTQKDDGATGAATATGGALNAAGLSAMYTTVIKLSAENKINVKNSWSLPLIDHMETLVMGNGQGAGAGAAAGKGGKQAPKQAAAAAAPKANDTDNSEEQPSFTKTGHAAVDAAMLNFQRASCALDASVKIYSYRVDDVWSTSYRVLENLSRSEPVPEGGGDSGGADGADGAGDDDEDGGGDKPGGRSKASRAGRKGASSTLEKNPAALCVFRLESAFDIDPLFHKMSAEFDAGGTAGMLLHRLALQGGCDLAFDSTDTPDVDGMRGGGYSYAMATVPAAAAAAAASSSSAETMAVPAAAALGWADTRALLATLLAGTGADVSSSGTDDDVSDNGATDAIAGLLRDPSASSSAASSVVGRLSSLDWSPSLNQLYDSHDRYAAAAGVVSAVASGGLMADAPSALPPPPAGSASGPALMALPSAIAAAAAAASSSSASAASSGVGAGADSGGSRDADGVLLEDEAEALAGPSEDGGAANSSWHAVSVLQGSMRRASLNGSAAAAANNKSSSAAAPESPGAFERLKQQAAASAGDSGAVPLGPLLSDLDVSAIDGVVMVLQEAAAASGDAGAALLNDVDDDVANRRDIYAGDDAAYGGGYGDYDDGDSDVSGSGGGAAALHNTTIVDLAALGLGAAAAGVKGKGAGAAGGPTAAGLAAQIAASAAGGGAGGGAVGLFGAANGKHWKFKAAAKKAAEEAAAAADGENKENEGGDEEGDGKAGLKGGKKKGGKKGPFFLDFTDDSTKPGKDAFVKAKKVAGAPSALAKAAAAKAAAAAAAAAAGGSGAPSLATMDPAVFGPRDSEQQTPGALERAEKAGGAAHLQPLALWQSELRSLRGPQAAFKSGALALACRPGVAVPVTYTTPDVSEGADVISAAPMPGAAAAMGLFSTIAGLGLGGGRGGSNNRAGGAGAGSAGIDDDDDDDDADDAGGGFGYGDGPGSYEGYGDCDGGLAADRDAAASSGAGAMPIAASAGFAAGDLNATSAFINSDAAASSSSSSGAGAQPVELVAAARHVEKIRVRYETVAKKVDVRALKEAMWGHIQRLPLTSVSHRGVEKDMRTRAAAADRLAGASAFIDPTTSGASAAAAVDEDDPSGDSRGPLALNAANGGGTSFAGVIRGLAGDLAGADAAAASAITVPFYFITVLHLANEHGLALGAAGAPQGTPPSTDGTGDPLADFAIRRLTA